MRPEDKLREFIIASLEWDRPDAELTDDFPLIEGEVLDSMGIFQIISFIEEEFGTEVADSDLVVENFATISDIARLVSR